MKSNMKKRLLALGVSVMLGLNALCFPASAESENLALGRPYTVTSDQPNSHSYAELDVDDGKMLTDGVKAPASWSDGRWAKYYRAGGRTVTVDLGALCEIEKVVTEFISDNAAGCYVPEEIGIFVSADGEHFSEVSVKSGNTAPFGPSEKRGCLIVSYDMPVEPVCGRYVALHFDVAVNTFIDEIEVFGKRETALTPPTDYTDILPPAKGAYLSRDALDGDKDIILFHAGYYPDDPSLVNNTEEVFLPFLACLDEDGRIVDTMFDSVMFLIMQGKCYSDGSLTIDGGETLLSDWQMLLDAYFSDTINLRALNNTAHTISDALGDPDYKIPIYLTIPYPKTGTLVFGDYNGDGKDETIRTYEDCLAVTEWFMDECIRRFEAGNYDKLIFRGFFNNSEGLTNSRYPYERQLAKDSVAMMHERGLKCVMIPYYQGQGIENVEEYGFDAVLMQPNLSFNTPLQDDPAGMMQDFDESAKQFGLGIEMEVNSSLIWDINKFAPFYLQYLRSASACGLMTDTIHAYYNGAGMAIFGRAAYSEDPAMRWLYDLTYKFIKGTLSLPENIVAEGFPDTLSVEVGSRVSGTISLSGDWRVDLKITKQPLHGIVQLSADGRSYTFKADRKYSGEDSFDYEFTVYGVPVASGTVNVRIGSEDPVSDISDLSESSDRSLSEPQEQKKTPWGLIAGIGGAFLLACAAAVTVIRKKKK